MTNKAVRAKDAWRASLAAHRRPWPEWAELERRVGDRDFVTYAIGPHVFVFSGAVVDEPPLSRQIASRGAPVREIGAPFPTWIAALVGLGCEDAGDLASAGVLAGDLWPPDKLRAIATPEDWADYWHFGPLTTPVPARIFGLQRNRSGTPLFSDGANVFGFAQETQTLEKLAELEPFTRFCLRYALAGKDWADAWRRGDGEPEGFQRLSYY